MLLKLKVLRNRRGTSQQQLADVIGVSQQSINKYENHDVEPDIATLKAIADYFDTSVDYLIGHTEYEWKIEPRSAYELTKEEKDVVDGFRKMNTMEREIVKLIIKNHK